MAFYEYPYSPFRTVALLPAKVGTKKRIKPYFNNLTLLKAGLQSRFIGRTLGPPDEESGCSTS